MLKGAGIDLAADVSGPEGAPIILFLHGGGQTRQSWARALTEAERRGYRAISLDMRGHGDSGWSPDADYNLDRFVADLRSVLAVLPSRPMVVGASLGGLTALLTAAAPDTPITALVLVDVTPTLDPEGSREIGAFMSGTAKGFDTLEEAADAVSAYLPHRPRPKDTSGLKKNLRHRDGRWHWHWDPAFLKLGEDAELEPETAVHFHTAAKALTIPALLVRGQNSRIVSKEAAREFQQLVPHAEWAEIDGAHHMVAGDANDDFNNAIFAFLERQSVAA